MAGRRAHAGPLQPQPNRACSTRQPLTLTAQSPAQPPERFIHPSSPQPSPRSAGLRLCGSCLPRAPARSSEMLPAKLIPCLFLATPFKCIQARYSANLNLLQTALLSALPLHDLAAQPPVCASHSQACRPAPIHNFLPGPFGFSAHRRRMRRPPDRSSLSSYLLHAAASYTWPFSHRIPPFLPP